MPMKARPGRDSGSKKLFVEANMLHDFPYVSETSPDVISKLAIFASE